jgi:hypothetical protein
VLIGPPVASSTRVDQACSDFNGFTIHTIITWFHQPTFLHQLAIISLRVSIKSRKLLEKLQYLTRLFSPSTIMAARFSVQPIGRFAGESQPVKRPKVRTSDFSLYKL